MNAYPQINNSNFPFMNNLYDENNNSFLYINNLKIKKKGKPFTERTGDWFCSSCKNLNFAFRMVCNRCHLSKAESQKINEKQEMRNKKDCKDNMCILKNEKEEVNNSINNSKLNLDNENVNK